MYIDGIEEIDKKILKELKDNARASYSEIAAKVGISRVAVKNRVKALEDKHVIEGYKTIINPTGDPNGCKFIVDIETEPDKLNDVVDYMAMFKCNRQVYTTSGESRIHVVGYAPNYATYKSYVEQLFAKITGVRRIVVHQLIVTHKDVDGGVEYERNKENTGGDGSPGNKAGAEGTGV